MTFKSIIILSCFIANMEQDIFLDMFFAFFFAVSENLFTFAAIKGSHWRNLPKVLSRVAVFRDAATFVRKGDFRARVTGHLGCVTGGGYARYDRGWVRSTWQGGGLGMTEKGDKIKKGAPPSPKTLLTLNLILWKTRCKGTTFLWNYQMFWGFFLLFNFNRHLVREIIVSGPEAPGVRSGVIDLFPKDKNRETEVSRGFRFFFRLVLK